jgi:hypothetical protein
MNGGDRWRARLPALVTAGLLALAALNLWWGAWALAAPRHFFNSFPGFGERWTGAYPPYNQHLVTDLGATFLTLFALLLVAAILRDARVTTVVLFGVIVFNALHLAYHAAHHGELTGGSLVASLASLALGVIGPAVLLVLARKASPRR